MATLTEIENFLNIEIGDKRLRPGKKKANKNQYYYYPELYYIVKLTKDKWMIVEDCRKTRQLLRKYCWCYGGNAGYAKTHVNTSTKHWHRLFLNYEDGLVTDHVNNKRFDNRNDNLRVVTQKQNMRNRSKQSNNTSGKQGVSRFTRKNSGLQYWRVQIYDNNSKRITKLFSIKKLGDDEAKRQAIAWRIQKEQEYGYKGD